jgi:hypothetical protein
MLEEVLPTSFPTMVDTVGDAKNFQRTGAAYPLLSAPYHAFPMEHPKELPLRWHVPTNHGNIP